MIIWFNHWFSTAYNIIKLIKADNPDCHIIGTNENLNAIMLAACDERYTEPAISGDDYVNYCLEFCKENSVDLFVPRREMLSISRRKKEFEAIGVAVMVDDYSKVSLLNHKDQAYAYLKSAGATSIPDYYIATTVNQFENAYNQLLTKYKEVCIKFVHDEGGKSFRLIDNNRKGYYALFKKQNTRMTYEAIREALAEKKTFAPLMIMPNLPGDEISVDCLNTNSGLIMLPRVKDSTKIERLVFAPAILEKTKEIYDKVNLECPCNIQFKYLDNVPYLLEVNTRMSGGVHMSCAASNINIPSIAVNKLRGCERSWVQCTEEKYVTHADLPIVF